MYLSKWKSSLILLSKGPLPILLKSIWSVGYFIKGLISINSLGTPDTSRRGRSTLNARKAFTSNASLNILDKTVLTILWMIRKHFWGITVILNLILSFLFFISKSINDIYSFKELTSDNLLKSGCSWEWYAYSYSHTNTKASLYIYWWICLLLS